MFKFAALLLLPLVAFLAFMFVKQADMVFFPLKEIRDAPSNWGINYENVNFDTLDKSAKLHGWFIPKKRAAKTLLFFHGNAGNISQRIESIKIFHDAGVNVLIIDYRGYGMSTGKPSEDGLYDDARSAWQYLTQTKGISASDIVIFGRSLGGVVATQLASEVTAAGLIVESSFSSARDVAHQLMPFLSRLVYLRYSFDAETAIHNVKSPLLVLHSPADDIIPFKLGRKVYEAGNNPKTFYELSGDHNSGFMDSQPGYQQALEKFLSSLDKS